MRFLFVAQANHIGDQRSYDAAFRRAVAEGATLEVRTIPFLGVVRHEGWDALWAHLWAEARSFSPDVVFFQYFHGFNDRGVDPRPLLASLKRLQPAPLVFVSLGDLYDTVFPFRRVPNRAFRMIARTADATFVTSLGRLARFLESDGVRNIVFLPHACDADALPEAVVEDYEANMPDVVMVGSCAVTLRPKMFPWTLRNAWRRRETARLLWKRYRKRFAVYGHGWKGNPAWNGSVDFRDQMNLFAKCRVSVDAPAPVDVEYYGSDRPFYIAGAGSSLAMQHIAGFERMLPNLSAVHYYQRLSDVVAACDAILETDADELLRRRQATVDLVRRAHTIDRRVDTILSVAEALRANEIERIRPWHFVDQDFSDAESRGVINWRGLR